jgi:hypothetical protein
MGSPANTHLSTALKPDVHEAHLYLQDLDMDWIELERNAGKMTQVVKQKVE